MLFEISQLLKEQRFDKYFICTTPVSKKEVLKNIELPSIKTDFSKDHKFAGLCCNTNLTKEQEFHLFRKLNYIKHYTIKLLKKRDIRSLSDEEITIVKKNIEEVSKLKKTICSYNGRLVVNIATKMYKPYQDGDDLEELVADGLLGLVYGIDYFDYRKELKFSTYAYYAILDHISEPKTKKVNFHKAVKFDEELIGHAPSNNDVFEDVDRREEILNKQILVNNLLSRVSERERQVISDLYGIGTKQKTLVEIGQKLNVTKERIRQIREKGFRNILANERVGG